MVKFTSKSEVTQACMNSIYYNLRNKISDRKYAEVVQTVNSGFKDGSMESIWKSDTENPTPPCCAHGRPGKITPTWRNLEN